MNLNDIIIYWKQTGIKLNQGISLKEIEALENKIEFKFPQSFKAFYSEINGFKNSEWDENMFTLFSIERIEEEYFDSNDIMFVPFCDYLINSHQIGFNKTDKKSYIKYYLDLFQDKKVADTFEQTIVAIVNNSEKIY